MSTTTVNPSTLTIRLDRLLVPENVREIDDEWVAQLQRSITARGKVTEPVKVIDADHAVHGDQYDHVLVAGFHRVEAARRLGHKSIPGVYGEPEHEHIDRAVENMMRKKLNPYEEAVAIRHSLDEGNSEEQAGEQLGLTKNLVTRRMRLLELPDAAQRLVGDGTLTLATVEPMREIAQANPELLDVVVEFIGEYAHEIAPDDLAYQPLSILFAAVEATERDVFVGHLSEVHLTAVGLIPDDETTTALIAEARELHNQNPYSLGDPHIRFTEADVDRARAAGVLLEFGEEIPVVTDLAVYQDLCRTAIAAGVEALKQQAAEQTEEEESIFGTPGKKAEPKPDDKRITLEKKHRGQMRQLAATAHSANLDLGDSLRKGLTVVDTDDINVARFFVYGLLGQDNSSGWARDTVVSAIALRGIRFVIGDFREDKTKARKDGSRGALRIVYGDGSQHENQSHWLWKYLDGARSAGELYGRALVVIAAEQYASRLVVPGSQQINPLSWPSHKDTALKALSKLAGPHMASTLKALEKAIVKADREHKEAMSALLESKKTHTKDTAETDVEQDASDGDADDGLRTQALSFIQGQPGITIPELGARMGIKQNCLYHILPALEDEGKVSKQGRGWHSTDANTTDELDTPATLPGLLPEEEEQLGTDDPPVIEAPLAPPVDASKFEQPNEGPAPMPDLPDNTDPEPDGEAVPAAKDVLDASADIDF
jgi:ParB/RepB/Spo0J family partition protein